MTCFVGKNLEPCPREPVWEIPHCPRFRQSLAGVVRVRQDARLGKTSTTNFPGTTADVNVRVASRIDLRSGFSVDLASIP